MKDGGGGIVTLIVYLAIAVVMVVSLWKVFEKAGKPGWAVLIPIYNLIVMLDIVKRPTWWVILFLIPLVNIVVAFILAMDMAEAFGKSKGWGIGMLAILGVVGYPMLAFTDASYTAPSRAT